MAAMVVGSLISTVICTIVATFVEVLLHLKKLSSAHPTSLPAHARQ